MATLHESELDIALSRLTPEWLAGFFDGEGCVSIVRRHGVPSLTVNIVQAEYNILALIMMKFDGDRKPVYRRSQSDKKKNYLIQFTGKNALPFLEYIRPHVILKRKLVEWAIEMAGLHMQAGGNRRNEFGLMPEPVRARREELMEQVRSENKKGLLITQ